MIFRECTESKTKKIYIIQIFFSPKSQTKKQIPTRKHTQYYDIFCDGIYLRKP